MTPNHTQHCPACGAESEKIYRCDTCGHDLTDVGGEE